ncbi:MAG: ABC transporter permease [Candidatus Bathyarchaeia archaeon]|nr:ABC transporter permease [Candidatus Bathyarchaeota archaeon]
MSSIIKRALKKFVKYFRIFSASKVGIAGLIIIIVFLILALGASIIAPYDPKATYVSRPFTPPGFKHLLGTDEAGRDVLSQIIYGSQVALIVGFSAAAVSTAIGTLIGLISGYYGGAIDTVLMRITDIFLIIPMLPLAILLALFFGPSLLNIIVLIGFLGWPGLARQIRAQVLSLKELPFVEALHALGASSRRIIFFHLLPNISGLIFASMIGGSVGAILAESGLAFLGLSDPRIISWGRIVARAIGSGALVRGAWWPLVFPGLCIALLACGFSFFSHGLMLLVSPFLRERR